MEPMSEMTAKVGASAERAKFRSELRKAAGEKRKRDAGDDKKSDDIDSDDDGDDGDDSGNDKGRSGDIEKPTHDDNTDEKKKKRKAYGVKGPNPLSVKKRKKTPSSASASTMPKTDDGGAPRKKRIRKHKAQPADGSGPAATEA